MRQACAGQLGVSPGRLVSDGSDGRSVFSKFIKIILLEAGCQDILTTGYGKEKLEKQFLFF